MQEAGDVTLVFPWIDLNYFPQTDMLRERVYLLMLCPLSVWLHSFWEVWILGRVSSYLSGTLVFVSA